MRKKIYQNKKLTKTKDLGNELEAFNESLNAFDDCWISLRFCFCLLLQLATFFATTTATANKTSAR